MVAKLFKWQSVLLLIAIGIVAFTIYYSTHLSKKIEKEERQRVHEWALAVSTMAIDTSASALELANSILVNNEDMPMLITDSAEQIIDYKNIDTNNIKSKPEFLNELLSKFKSENKPIDLHLGTNPVIHCKLYYGNTQLLSEVRYYPIVQLIIVAIFICLIVILINTNNKSTQNQVWAGMAKETAHQMGTPLTSLQGWIELLKDNPDNAYIIEDVEKDVERLILVSERFSKIGSKPKLETIEILPLIEDMVYYMKKRAPGKVSFSISNHSSANTINISKTLFNWVLENLLKNALDAMESGIGSISVELSNNNQYFYVDVKDTGKGISAANLSKVFNPGFTTKKRGWGLGLSLSKRIMNHFHSGDLIIKQSEVNKGTTFRICIPLNSEI